MLFFFFIFHLIYISYFIIVHSVYEVRNISAQEQIKIYVGSSNRKLNFPLWGFAFKEILKVNSKFINWGITVTHSLR